MEHHPIPLERQQRLAACGSRCTDGDAELLVDGINLDWRQGPALRDPVRLVPLDGNAVLFVDEPCWPNIELSRDLVEALQLQHEVLE